MLNISVEKNAHSHIDIYPMSIKRDWMDVTPEKHAYRCFPVTQANMIGWYLAADEDVSFIWNGINDTSSDNVKILKGENFTYTGRGQSSVSFNTGLVFRTDENISMFTITPVNYFSTDFEVMSSLISTSWHDSDFPLAIKVKTANKEIIIKAGQPIATIIPISLTSLDNTAIDMYRYSDPDGLRHQAHKSYGEAAQEINMRGEWTDWYRDAINEKGETLGKHETKALRLKVNNHILDNTENGII